MSSTLATIVAGNSALAADKGAQFGILAGLSVTDADNTGSFTLSGVKGQAHVSTNFSLGGYYLISDSSGEPRVRRINFVTL